MPQASSDEGASEDFSPHWTSSDEAEDDEGASEDFSPHWTSSDEAEEEPAPQSEYELWLLFAKSVPNRFALKGFMTSMGLQILQAKGRADMEVRLAQALTNRGADCSQVNQTLRELVAALPAKQKGLAQAAFELVAALPAKQKGLAQAAFGFDPVSMPCHCICPAHSESSDVVVCSTLTSIPRQPPGIYPAPVHLSRTHTSIPLPHICSAHAHLPCVLASIPHPLRQCCTLTSILL